MQFWFLKNKSLFLKRAKRFACVKCSCLIPGGGAVGISEGGEGVSSVAAAAGVSLAGALGSGGGAVLGAGASLGGASPE